MNNRGGRINKIPGCIRIAPGAERPAFSPNKPRPRRNKDENTIDYKVEIQYNTPMIVKKPLSPQQTRGKSNLEKYTGINNPTSQKRGLGNKGAGWRFRSPLNFNEKPINKTYIDYGPNLNIQDNNNTLEDLSSYAKGKMMGKNKSFMNPQGQKKPNNSKIIKLGTVYDKNNHKLSIVNKIRRNTNLNTQDTQQVIEGIWPISSPLVSPTKIRKTAVSPNPQGINGMRAFSPWFVTEFDESKEIQRQSSSESSRNNDRMLDQFGSRNAASPNRRNPYYQLNPHATMNAEFPIRVNSPVPHEKTLPLIQKEGTNRNQTIMGVRPKFGSRGNTRNINRNELFKGEGIRSPSRNGNQAFCTINAPVIPNNMGKKSKEFYFWTLHFWANFI